MADQDAKVRANRLRRWAKRLGLELHKSRAKEIKVDDRGGWQVLDAKRKNVKAGEHFHLSLDTVERYLAAVEDDLAGRLTIDPEVIAGRGNLRVRHPIQNEGGKS